MGGALGIDALRPAGEDDADGVVGADGVKAHVIGVDFAVDVILADAAGDKLVILAAEVKDKNFLVLHTAFLSLLLRTF